MNTETLIEVDHEARQYEQWERKEKNRILSLHDTKQKQEAWDKLFPRTTHDDSWLDEAVVF